MRRQRREVEHIARLVSDLYEVAGMYRQQDSLMLSLTAPDADPKRVTMLEDRLRTAGYEFSLSAGGDTVTLTVVTHRRLSVPRLNLILFVATLFSVYVVPVFLSQLEVAAVTLSRLAEQGQTIGKMDVLQLSLQKTLTALAHGAGLEFTAALLSILLVHEMGHFLVSRHHGIVASWPYFIPAPSIIGTFGAVIKMKSPFWSRNELVQVGAAGPIAGWLVAVLWLVYGLTRSSLLPVNAFPPGQMLFSLDGDSLLIKMLVPMLVGNPVKGYAYQLSEAAFAGWVGLLVTALNLMPVSQLDGGHILYGAIGARQRRVAWLFVAILLVLGLYWRGWWLYAALGMFLGVGHPPTMNDSRPLSPLAKTLVWVSVVILLLSFIPVPFSM